ncbi:MAG: type II toxin-antitoxin system RelE/ParE family toxin [Terracidiphilus sp.]
MKPYTFHPEAEAEADAAFEHYWTRNPVAAFGFDEELRDAFLTLRVHPQICPLYLHSTRRVVLKRYPFSVVFRERLHDIQIVAIAHAKRRPGYWAMRL